MMENIKSIINIKTVKHVKNIFLICPIVILTACSTASGPSFSSFEKNVDPAHSSRVYLYCTKDISIIGAKTFIDGKPWATLKSQGFIFKNLQPGVHQITVLDPNATSSLIAPPKSNYTFMISKAETKYLKIDWLETNQAQWIAGGMPGGMAMPGYKLSVININAQTAKTEMDPLHLSQ